MCFEKLLKDLKFHVAEDNTLFEEKQFFILSKVRCYRRTVTF